MKSKAEYSAFFTVMLLYMGAKAYGYGDVFNTALLSICVLKLIDNSNQTSNLTKK